MSLLVQACTNSALTVHALVNAAIYFCINYKNQCRGPRGCYWGNLYEEVNDGVRNYKRGRPGGQNHNQYGNFRI